MASSNQKARLTKRVIDSAQPAERRYVIHDASLPGFRLVVSPSGRKSFSIRYRVGGGRSGTLREPTIGTYGPMTVDAARRIANEWLLAASRGEDPSLARKSAREAPLMSQLFERYLQEHARPHKKPASIKEDTSIIEERLLPFFGRKKVAEVARADVAKFHAAMSATPTRANRCVALLSKAFNLAEVWGMRPDGSNPCRQLKKYKETSRKRFLSPAELGRLGEALRRAERGELEPMMPSAIFAIRLLVLTGLRSGEVRSLRWSWIDVKAGRINLPDSKTGEKSVVLNAPALAVLSSIPRIDDNPYVLVGAKPGAAIVNVKTPWAKIRAAAGLDDVRIHDLRHSFAAVGAGSGQSLHIVGSLLGHTQAQTTRRYAHLADDPLRAASELIGAKISAAMGGDCSPTKSEHPMQTTPKGQS